MRLSSGNMHNIANLELPWGLAFTANQPTTHEDSQDLPSLVSMPEGPGAAGKHDVVSHAYWREPLLVERTG